MSDWAKSVAEAFASKLFSGFKINSGSEEKSAFLAQEKPGSFNFFFEVKGSKVYIFGLVDNNQVPPQLDSLKYHSSLDDTSMAMLDVLIEFSYAKDIRGLEALSLREIDNFLRDDNITPAFSHGGTTLYPLFEATKNKLKEIFEEKDHVRKNFQSPIISEDYEHQSDYFPFKGKTNFPSLDTSEKMLMVSKIIQDHISKPLRRDNGSLYCVFADDSLIVIEYGGACQGCQYSLSSTLNFIQRVFQLETNEPNLLVMTDS